jgi:hypothetical protein
VLFKQDSKRFLEDDTQGPTNRAYLAVDHGMNATSASRTKLDSSNLG